jgi:transcriptional regulator with XRE-family HTH domain
LGFSKVCQVLSEQRRQQGFTQIQLAEKIGITQTLLSDYETGRVRLNADMIIRISQTLEISADTLLGISSSKTHSSTSLKLAQRMRKIEQLPQYDQKALLKTIDNALKGSGIEFNE